MTSIQTFLRCNKALALVEFGLLLPILILLLIGTIEVSRYAIIHQKLDKTANAMADFVTQGDTVSNANLDDFASSADQIMRPFNFSGTIIFSSAVHFNTGSPPCMSATPPCIAWQASRRGSAVSRIGSVGSVPTLPNGYTIVSGQNVIVTEVFMNYSPMLLFTGILIPALGDHEIYKIVVYKPRQRNLYELL